MGYSSWGRHSKGGYGVGMQLHKKVKMDSLDALAVADVKSM